MNDPITYHIPLENLLTTLFAELSKGVTKLDPIKLAAMIQTLGRLDEQNIPIPDLMLTNLSQDDRRTLLQGFAAITAEALSSIMEARQQAFLGISRN